MKINFHLDWSRLYSYVDKKEFGDEIADAVDILTHDKNVPYEDYMVQYIYFCYRNHDKLQCRQMFCLQQNYVYSFKIFFSICSASAVV